MVRAAVLRLYPHVPAPPPTVADDQEWPGVGLGGMLARGRGGCQHGKHFPTEILRRVSRCRLPCGESTTTLGGYMVILTIFQFYSSIQSCDLTVILLSVVPPNRICFHRRPWIDADRSTHRHAASYARRNSATETGIDRLNPEGSMSAFNSDTDETPCEDEDVIADWIDQQRRQVATSPQSPTGRHPDVRAASEQPDR